MTRPSLASLWPRSLAARLAVMLWIALAVAQSALYGVLRLSEDSVIEAVGHGQALNQTVALARLLETFPAADGARLAAAFASRRSCASLAAEPPPERAMSEAETRLAAMIAPMLHGLPAGNPQAAIESSPPRDGSCADDPHFDRPPSGEAPHVDAPRAVGGSRFVTVSMTVPLADGRWLTTRTGVEASAGWNRIALLSFLVSSLAVAAVAAAAVRAQTRSLRALAEASERFGRGESVAPLDARGPAEVAAAAQAFNTMQARLGAYLRDRLRLLAGISHDLRTPLTTLRLKAEFVDDAEVRDGLVATIEELTTICEATLAFSRAEATTEPTQSRDLAELAEEIAAEFAAAGQDVRADPAAPLPYPCRPVALKRALRNLVENAVRYGERARIAVRAETGGVTIRVDDDGPGLPADQVDEAFKPFVRLEASRSRETGGLGLGLAIARSIVQAHGGTLSLANRPGGGLRAQIELPPSRAAD